MSGVQRWHPLHTDDLCPLDSGKWVKYEDCAKLEEENQELIGLLSRSDKLVDKYAEIATGYKKEADELSKQLAERK